MDEVSLGAVTRSACLDQVNRALRRSALLGLPASMMMALIVGSSVPLVHRIVFVSAVWIADIVCFVAAGAYLRRRAAGQSIDRYWLGPVSVALIGFAWGSLALLGLPNAQHENLRAIYLLFVCAVSCTYVVGAAARRLYFYASSVPLFVPVMAVFVTTPDRPTRLLGFAIPIYFTVMASMHHEVHSVVVSELGLRERNDVATAQLRYANDELARQALHDELTGLANRTLFMEALQRAVNATTHNPIGVLYIDIDWFKVINDNLGHGTGDALLAKVAARMTSVLRSHDLIARFGGDEFVVLCTELHGHAEAIVIGERLAGVFASPFRIDGRVVNVTASIGVATNVHATDTADTLLSHADAAQYQAKQQGRNRVEVFDRELRDALVRRLEDEQRLREALTNNEIVAWYQPIVDLHTGHIVGAEALARWQHPQRGVLDAYKFVPLAEETGLILDIDDAVIRNALTTRAGLHATDVADDFRVWVNISAKQFGRANPTEQLVALLEEVACDPCTVGVEITETAVLNDMETAAEQIRSARSLGIQVALDDFGVGHSSLTLLRNLPIDKVKIDRAFIANIVHNIRDRAIVRNVLALANDLGLAVVAEGVETPEQAHVLRDLGCRYGQGWLWAKALPVRELVDYTRAANHTAKLTAITIDALQRRSSGSS